MYTYVQYTCTYTPSTFPTEGYVYAPSISMIKKSYMVMYLLPPSETETKSYILRSINS